jgi:hypothetical protein
VAFVCAGVDALLPRFARGPARFCRVIRAYAALYALHAALRELMPRYTRLCRVARAYAALRALMPRYTCFCRVARAFAASHAEMPRCARLIGCRGRFSVTVWVGNTGGAEQAAREQGAQLCQEEEGGRASQHAR